jgi:hypothetical protein
MRRTFSRPQFIFGLLESTDYGGQPFFILPLFKFAMQRLHYRKRLVAVAYLL